MSFVIIGIIMLVLANTMIMAARERTREYAVLKTLGFSAFHLIGLILGESLVIALIGGGIGITLTYPIVAGFEASNSKRIFPILLYRTNYNNTCNECSNFNWSAGINISNSTST